VTAPSSGESSSAGHSRVISGALAQWELAAPPAASQPLPLGGRGALPGPGRDPVDPPILQGIPMLSPAFGVGSRLGAETAAVIAAVGWGLIHLGHDDVLRPVGQQRGAHRFGRLAPRVGLGSRSYNLWYSNATFEITAFRRCSNPSGQRD
jgi:hypothetical protein